MFLIIYGFIGLVILTHIRFEIYGHIEFVEGTQRKEAKARGLIVYCIWLFDAYKMQAVYTLLTLFLLSMLHQLALQTGIIAQLQVYLNLILNLARL